MQISALKELSSDENRVALTPDSIKLFQRLDLEVLIEDGAGITSGYPDKLYVENGAKIATPFANVAGIQCSRGGVAARGRSCTPHLLCFKLLQPQTGCVPGVYYYQHLGPGTRAGSSAWACQASTITSTWGLARVPGTQHGAGLFTALVLKNTPKHSQSKADGFIG